MKVSVVVPVYNEEQYIQNCLESLINQEVPADEIIVVDNNSTDNSIKIAGRYPVKIIKEKKQGITPARNRGFDNAKYELIVRTDADVIVPKNWIKQIKKNFQKLKIDALYGPITFYDLPVKTPVYAKSHFDFIKRIHKGKEAILFGPNMAITKNIWKKVRDNLCLDDNTVHEDHDLGIHIYEIGGKIKRDNKLIVKTSARRMYKKPRSFFIEYPSRLFKTLKNHHGSTNLPSYPPFVNNRE